MYDPLIIRNKYIGEEELGQIRELLETHWNRGRTYISRELCRLWNLRQDNGLLKEQVCRILLRKLEDKGYIELPPRISDGVLSRNRRYYRPPAQVPDFIKCPLSGTLQDLPRITLKLARHNPEEKLWNYLVYNYHYKSLRIIVGAHIKVLAYAENIPVACLAWSSSVFRIACRDAYIGWDNMSRNQNIRHVVNNSRFLILPWIELKNLASHLLGISAKQIPKYWKNIYGFPLYLLETFVDRSRFRGACYQAANWYNVGHTTGYAKKNKQIYQHGIIKDVYIYPLRKDFKARLREGGAL